MNKTDQKMLKKYETYLFYGALAIMITLVATSCSPMERFNDWIGWKDDNLLEESIEFVIDHEIGFDVDLSPRSSE